MPRTKLQNVKRRGAVYWWTRSIRPVHLGASKSHPITWSLSLFTKDLATARRRAVELTAFSERLRVTMVFRIGQEGLDEHAQKKIYAAELRAYRDWLVNVDALELSIEGANSASVRQGRLDLLDCLWTGIRKEGIAALSDPGFVDRNYSDFQPTEREEIFRFLHEDLAVGSGLERTASEHLKSEKLLETPQSVAVAVRQTVVARADATAQYRDETFPNVSASVIRPSDPDLRIWLDATPLEAADLFIENEYPSFEHRKAGRRTGRQISDSTKRDIRWACNLLAKNMAPGRTLASISEADLLSLDAMFDRLPVSVGKSPRDRETDVTLLDIEQRTMERIEAGELLPEDMGLSIGTTNKHWSNLAKVHRMLRDKVPEIPILDFARFRAPEDRDDRDVRAALTPEQGRTLFSSPPWTGCDDAKRLKPGTAIVHDGLYFVPMLVWYTGARREEICKLQVSDIEIDAKIPFLKIQISETGTVKTHAAKRKIPLHSELLRLGFADFVEAMKAAGETVLFPELYPSGKQTKRTIGDVFYKIWWTKLRCFVPDLQRGQAMHAVRHMVSNELKQRRIQIEHRNDVLGHSQRALGDGALNSP